MRGSKTLLVFVAFSLLFTGIIALNVVVPANSNGAPVITLNSPLNNSAIINGTFVDLDATAGNGLDQVWYSLNGGGNTSLPPPFDINTSTWVNGTTYSVDVWANDTIGDTSHELYQFMIILDLHDGDLVIGVGEIYHILLDFKQLGNITIQHGGFLIIEDTHFILNNTGLGQAFIRVNGSIEIINSTYDTTQGWCKIEITDNATADFSDSDLYDADVYCGLLGGLNDTPTFKISDSKIFRLYGYDYANIEIHNESEIVFGNLYFYDNSNILIKNIDTSHVCFFYDNSTAAIENSTMSHIYAYSFSEVTMITCNLTQYAELHSNSKAIAENMSTGTLIPMDDSEALVKNSTFDIIGPNADNITIKDSSLTIGPDSPTGFFNIEWLWCENSSVNMTNVIYNTLINDNSMFGVIGRRLSLPFTVNATLEADAQVEITDWWQDPPMEALVLNTTSPSQDSFSDLNRYIYVTCYDNGTDAQIRIYYTIDEIPVQWYHSFDSKVRVGIDSLRTLVEIFRVRYYFLRKRYG